VGQFRDGVTVSSIVGNDSANNSYAYSTVLTNAFYSKMSNDEDELETQLHDDEGTPMVRKR